MMEVGRGGETSFAFQGRPRRTDSSASNASTSSSAGPAAVVLLLAVVVVLFVPSYVSAWFRGVRLSFGGGLVKNWWDVLNLVLVLCAITCGVLGRNMGSAGEESAERGRATSNARDVHHWVAAGYDASFGGRDQVRDFGDARVVVGDESAATGMGRLKRNSSSYPDLREEAWPSGDGWRFADDSQLHNHHRNRRSEGIRAWEGTPRDTEFKTITVDTMSRTPPRRLVTSSSPEEEPRRMSPKKSGLKKQEGIRDFDRRKIVEKAQVSPSGSPTPPPPPPPPPPPLPLLPSSSPHRRLEKLPRRDLGQRTSSKRFHGLAKVLSSQPTQSSIPPGHIATSPPPPPPPPPASPMREPSRNNKRGSGGAKEIKTALAQFYQKKKRSEKNKRISDDQARSPPSSSPQSSTVPPPPPPLPPRLSSGFFQRFTNKKGGSKSKRIHSVPVPPPPPPPPLPPSTRASVARVDSFVFPPSPPPPPPPPLHPRKDLRNRSTDRPEKHSSISDAAANEGQTEGPEGNLQTQLFCLSPDVNTKADVFIARLRADWKLEKLNSIREKQQQ